MPEVELIGGPYDGHHVNAPVYEEGTHINFPPPNLAQPLITGKEMYEVYIFDGLEKAKYVGQHERRESPPDG